MITQLAKNALLLNNPLVTDAPSKCTIGYFGSSVTNTDGKSITYCCPISYKLMKDSNNNYQCCQGNQQVINGKCACPTGQTISNDYCCPNTLVYNTTTKTCDCPNGQLYNSIVNTCVCPTGTTYLNGTCCPKTKVNGRTCCLDDQYNSNGKCCPIGTTNFKGTCCPNGTTKLYGNCCPNDTTNLNGICCPKKQINGRTCCPNGQIPSNGKCCPNGTTNLNGTCCPAGNTNLNGTCCPKNQINGSTCCPNGLFPSNGKCCPAGNTNLNGTCCPNDKVNGRTCCPNGQISSKGKCVCMPGTSLSNGTCVQCDNISCNAVLQDLLNKNSGFDSNNISQCNGCPHIIRDDNHNIFTIDGKNHSIDYYNTDKHGYSDDISLALICNRSACHSILHQNINNNIQFDSNDVSECNGCPHIIYNGKSLNINGDNKVEDNISDYSFDIDGILNHV